MDPLTIGAIAIIAGKFWSWFDKANARDEFNEVIAEYNGVVADFQHAGNRLIRLTETMGNQRLSYFRAVFPLLRRTVGQIGPVIGGRRHAFKMPDMDRISHLLGAARKMKRPKATIIDNTVTWTAVGVLAIQGMEQLDTWGVIELPVLDNSMAAIVSGASGDAADFLTESLPGLAAESLADVISGFVLIFGIFRMGYNFMKAGEFREQRDGLKVKLEEVKVAQRRLAQIERRADRIQEGLHASAYEAFKWSWAIGEWSKVHGRLTRPPDRYGRALDDAARQLWDFLNAPLLDSNGAAHPGFLPAPVMQ